MHAALVSLGVVLTAGVTSCNAVSTRDAALTEIAQSPSTPATSASRDRVERTFKWQFWTPIGGACWAILVGLFAVRIASKKDTESINENGHEEFLGPLHVFHEAVKRKKQLSDGDERFRVVLHRVDLAGNLHEQITPYLGWTSEDPARRPGPGRSWSNELGLVGLAIRTDDTLLVADLDVPQVTPDAIIHAMMQKYGYTKEKAGRLCPGRLSSMVVLVRTANPGPVTAALYCDSSVRGFFCDDVKELGVAAGIGIASYVKLRYS